MGRAAAAAKGQAAANAQDMCTRPQQRQTFRTLSGRQTDRLQSALPTLVEWDATLSEPRGHGVARCGESNPLVRLEPCLCMVLCR